MFSHQILHGCHLVYLYSTRKTTITEVAFFFFKELRLTLFQEPKLGGISVADASQVHTSAMLLLLIVDGIRNYDILVSSKVTTFLALNVKIS
jgi:hypothetical protein